MEYSTNGSVPPLLPGDTTFSDGVFTNNVKIYGTLNSSNGFLTGTPANFTTSGNITPQNILDGIITNHGENTLTFPTAVALLAALPNAQVGQTLNFFIGNDGFDTTILAGNSGAIIYNSYYTADNGPPTDLSLLIRIVNVTPGSEQYIVY